MNVTIHPGLLSGSVEIPCSKSFAHRLLIAAALADAPTEVRMNALNADIIATAECLKSLGADIDRTGTGYFVRPIQSVSGQSHALFCNESGSTLRFLLPVAAALGAECTFTGAGRLPERPNGILTGAINAHGAHTDSDLLPMQLTGKLTGGQYEIAGNVSSQYITGLLLALPLCEDDSEILLTTPLESAAYVDITLDVLKAFNIHVKSAPHGWIIPGRQTYRSPGSISAEGDWSAAAFWLTANHLGHKVECLGLNERSVQGDRAVSEMLNRLGGEIDASGIPDLVPALAVAAAFHRGTTCITGAARLRIKESDRLAAVAAMLRALGGDADELPDGLIIHGGKPLTGGTVAGCNDHRIVMAAAIAATAASGPVAITDAQAVHKSYPAFFDAFNQLGGHAHVEQNR